MASRPISSVVSSSERPDPSTMSRSSPWPSSRLVAMRIQTRSPGTTVTGPVVAAASAGFTRSANPARVAPPTSIPSAFTTTAPLMAESAWRRPAMVSATSSLDAWRRNGLEESVCAEMRRDLTHASTRPAVVRAATEWVLRTWSMTESRVRLTSQGMMIRGIRPTAPRTSTNRPRRPVRSR